MTDEFKVVDVFVMRQGNAFMGAAARFAASAAETALAKRSMAS